jgi:ubiquitin carboxyl-terminal hydrolase 16
MPDRPSNVVSYAAGASLAAVALIYVFGPNFTIDGDAGSSRKKTIVGLRNQANDCFINSVLQVLAGLPDLRIYLIRETHRRRIEDPGVYTNLVQPLGAKDVAEWKLQGLQEGLVTYGLKDMLDSLNERPIHKKSISPFPFVKVLEAAFRQRISRQQQDAQEFLQIVAERLRDEYHAGQRARLYARRTGLPLAANGDQSEQSDAEQAAGSPSSNDGNGAVRVDHAAIRSGLAINGASVDAIIPLEMEEGFPMEGKYESRLECQTCRYKTKPREETFCTITLAVPQVSYTTLNSCFDGIFKTEYIDDFKCEMCRLLQTVSNLEHELARSTSESFKAQTRERIEQLRTAIEIDPENPPADIELGDIRYAPKRKIAKTTRMTIFPKILAIHLSRSIYGVGQITQKNSARVAFPEQLSIGGLMDQHKYKLLGMVGHRGGHNSGHYEAFRRQNVPTFFANPNTFQPSEIYSKTPTPISTPEISARRTDSPAVSTPDLLSPSSGSSSSTPSLESSVLPPRSAPSELDIPQSPQVNAKDKDGDSSSLRSVAASTKSALAKLAVGKNGTDGTASPKSSGVRNAVRDMKPKRRKTTTDRWWRVSDEKVRDAKTGDVLSMQKEVYLLFYELDRDA